MRVNENERSKQTMTHSGWQHALLAAKTLAVLVLLGAALLAACWLASFFLYASWRMNPFHAGWWAWLDAARGVLGNHAPDAALATHVSVSGHGGAITALERRLIGSAVFGVLVAFGAPALGGYVLWERSGRRRLYGSARFASDAEIRAAGLL